MILKYQFINCTNEPVIKSCDTELINVKNDIYLGRREKFEAECIYTRPATPSSVAPECNLRTQQTEMGKRAESSQERRADRSREHRNTFTPFDTPQGKRGWVCLSTQWCLQEVWLSFQCAGERGMPGALPYSLWVLFSSLPSVTFEIIACAHTTYRTTLTSHLGQYLDNLNVWH